MTPDGYKEPDAKIVSQSSGKPVNAILVPRGGVSTEHRIQWFADWPDEEKYVWLCDNPAIKFVGDFEHIKSLKATNNETLSGNVWTRHTDKNGFTYDCPKVRFSTTG